MAIWIHFTKDPFNFSLNDGPLGGLCVYRNQSAEAIDEKERKWNRTPIYLECDEEFVNEFQSDPFGEDPDWDEFIIPSKNLSKVNII